MTDFPWTATSLTSLLIGLSIYALIASGRVSFRSGEPRRPVADTRQFSESTLSELLERLAFVEADNKKIRREWEDQVESFNRRWGSLTRQMRRDGARDQAEAPSEGDDANTDLSQLDLLPAPTPPAHAPARRLVAFSALRNR